MMKESFAILITVHNRKAKTLRCLHSLSDTWIHYQDLFSIKVFLTDDGSIDGTADAIRQETFPFEIVILQGDGNLFWNGGMINSWKAALAEGPWNGYVWLNDDTIVLQEFWQDLAEADSFSMKQYGKTGIYVGSTKNIETGGFSYGGFNYVNKITLKDRFVIPNGAFQPCEAGHGNITYVSSEVVEKMGIFCEKYWHGGTDHDYTYLAQKAGFPVLVLPHYSGCCENDHIGKRRAYLVANLKDRIKYFWYPNGYNMHNILLFNWRCFTWRVPFVFFATVFKMLFPKAGFRMYRRLRK